MHVKGVRDGGGLAGFTTIFSSSQQARIARGACSFSEVKELHISEKAVKAGVGLTSLSHESGKGDHVGSTGHLTVLVDLHIH